jgi:hypothetical protein
VSEGVSVDRAKISAVKASVGIGHEPVKTWRESYRRQDCGEFAARRILRGDCHSRRDAVYEQEAIPKLDTISRNRAYPFEHGLIPRHADVAALYSLRYHGAGNSGKINGNTVSNVQALILSERGYPVNTPWERIRTVYPVSKGMEYDENESREAKRGDEYVEQRDFMLQSCQTFPVEFGALRACKKYKP